MAHLLCCAGQWRPQSSTLSSSSVARARSTLHVLCPRLLILLCLAVFHKKTHTSFHLMFVSPCSTVQCRFRMGRPEKGERVKQLCACQFCGGSLPPQGTQGCDPPLTCPSQDCPLCAPVSVHRRGEAAMGTLCLRFKCCYVLPHVSPLSSEHKALNL